MALGVGKLFGGARRPPVKLALLAEPRTGTARPAAEILYRYLGQEEAAKKGEAFAKAVTQETLVDGWPIELTLIDGLEGGEDARRLWPAQDAFLVLWHGPEPITYGTAVRNAQLARERGRKEVPIVLVQTDGHLRDKSLKAPDVAGLLKDKKLALLAFDATLEGREGVAALVAEGARQALAAKNSDFRALLKTLAAAKGALELKKRGLHALPAALAALAPTLERLDISGNELGAWPPELALCTALRELKANAIGLTALPEDVAARLPRLQALHLEGNQLEELPPALADMKELKEVRLKGNPLPGYPKDVFASTALLFQHLRVLKSAASSAPARKGAGVHTTFHVLCLRAHPGPLEAVCRISALREGGEALGQELHTGTSAPGTAPLWDAAFTLTGIPLDARLRFEVFGVRDGALSGMLGDSLGAADVAMAELVKEPDAQRALPLHRNAAPTGALLDVRFVLAGEGVTRAPPAPAPLPLPAPAAAAAAKEGKRKGTDLKESKEEASGVFGVPLDALLERDRRVWGAGLRVPRLVEQAVEYLTLHGLALEGLFRIAGVQDEMKALRVGWNAGTVTDFKAEGSPHNVAGMLKAFLRELPVPLLTFDLGAELLKAADIRDEAAQIAALRAALDRLPAANRAVVELLVPFLAMVTDNAQVNRMHFANVAKVLGPNLYWSKDASAFDLTAIDKANDLTTLIIQYSPQLFDAPAPDPVRPRLRHRLAGHRAPITALAAADSDAAPHLYTADASGALRRWETEQCRPDAAAAQLDARVHALLFVAPARLFVAHAKGLQARSTAADALPVEHAWPDECFALARSDTHLYAAATQRLLLIALTAPERPVRTVALPAASDDATPRPVSAIAYAPAASQLWAAAERHVTVLGKEGGVVAHWSVNGQVAAMAAHDATASVWLACDDRLLIAYGCGPGLPLLRVLDALASRLTLVLPLGEHVWAASSKGELVACHAASFAPLAHWPTRALEPLAPAAALRFNRTHEQWHVWLAGADRFVNVWHAPTASPPPPLPVLAHTALPNVDLAQPSAPSAPTTPTAPSTPTANFVRQRRRPQLIVVEEESSLPAPQRATVARSSLSGAPAPASPPPARAPSPTPDPPRLRQRVASRAQLVEEEAAPMRAFVMRSTSQSAGLHVVSASEEAAEVKAQHDRVRAALAERQVAPDDAEKARAREASVERKRVDSTLAKLAKFGLAPSDASPGSSPLRRTSLYGAAAFASPAAAPPPEPLLVVTEPTPRATPAAPLAHPAPAPNAPPAASHADAPPAASHADAPAAVVARVVAAEEQAPADASAVVATPSEAAPPASDVASAQEAGVVMEATPPASDATPPASDAASAQEASVVMEAAPPASDATPPASDATPPASDATPPASDAVAANALEPSAGASSESADAVALSGEGAPADAPQV